MTIFMTIPEQPCCHSKIALQDVENVVKALHSTSRTMATRQFWLSLLSRYLPDILTNTVDQGKTSGTKDIKLMV